MPINPDQQTDMNAPRYGLPLDSCVGDDGPTPEQVTNISGPVGKKNTSSMGTVPIGYDGPGGS